MKLIDIANKIDKSNKNESYVNTDQFSSELNYEFDWIEQDRLKAYWIGNWYCTDSYVGYRMYFLDDEPVAFSTQVGRKCNEIFNWFSKELALKTRDYLISIMPNNKEDDLNFNLCDINKDVGGNYKIEYNSQILNPDKAVYNGKPIKILERIKEIPDWGIDKKLKIQLSNGEERIVNIEELDFKFHLI